MIGADSDALRRRAEAIVGQLSQVGIEATAEPVSSTIGGGSLPGEVLPSWAVVLTSAPGETIDETARRLRVGAPGVFGRIERDRLYLDLRTVLPEDDEGLRGAIAAAAG
jgi:L-seryl-tRNA(Ser) seleniumtransferase